MERESENYSRVMLYLNRGCTKLMRAVVSETIDKSWVHIEPQNRLGSFLFDKRKTLFPGDTRKNQQKRGFESILFPGYGRSTAMDQWDLQLLAFVALKTCEQSSVVLKMDITELKKIRNALCHSCDGALSDDIYTVYICKIRIIFKRTLKVLKKADTIFELDLLFDNLEFEANTAVYNESLSRLRAWYEYDKCQMSLGVRLEQFESGQQKIQDKLDKTYSLLQTSIQLQTGQVQKDDVVNMPDTEVVIEVKNCKPEEELMISNELVSLIDAKIRNDTVLKSKLSDDCFHKVSVAVEVAISELHQNGLKLIGVQHGCVVLCVRSSTYEKLKELWYMAMKGTLTELFHRVEHALELEYPEVKVDVFLPESEWWRVTVELTDALQNLSSLDSLTNVVIEDVTKDNIEYTPTSCIKSAKIDTTCLGRVCLNITPTSKEHLMHISEVCTNGKFNEKLKNIADALQEVCSTETLEIKVISDRDTVQNKEETCREHGSESKLSKTDATGLSMFKPLLDVPLVDKRPKPYRANKMDEAHNKPDRPDMEGQEQLLALNFGVAGTKKHLEESFEAWKMVPLYIGVTGRSGVGKSAFINAIRGLYVEDEGAAEIGVTETTTTVKHYPHPLNNQLILCDLPGIGTPFFPRETYFTDERIGFDRFDFFVILTADRFTDYDRCLVHEIKNRNKRFLFIRTKIDQDVREVRRKRKAFYWSNPDAVKDIIENIRMDCVENLKGIFHEKGTERVFLIDSYDSDNPLYDFDSINEQLLKNVQALKKDAFILSVTSMTPSIIESKKEILRGRMWKICAMSAANGAVPIPGASLALNVRIVLDEAIFYRQQLGLEDDKLKEVAKSIEMPWDAFKKELNLQSMKIDYTKTGIMLFCSHMIVPGMLGGAIGFAIPFAGSIIGAGLSIRSTHYALNIILDLMIQDAKKLNEYITKKQSL